jgi:hypothetical protein
MKHMTWALIRSKCSIIDTIKVQGEASGFRGFKSLTCVCRFLRRLITIGKPHFLVHFQVIQLVALMPNLVFANWHPMYLIFWQIH